MKKYKETIFEPVTDPELIEWIEENCYIEDGKRKHKTTEVDERKFRFDNYSNLSAIEKTVIDSAIDGALEKYAIEYNRLPKTNGRDERRRLSSMLRSGIDGAKAMDDTNTAETLQKHLDLLPETIVTKNEILKEVRANMMRTCRILGKSVFEDLAKEMVGYFTEEVPTFTISTDDDIEIFTFDQIGFFQKYTYKK